MSSSTWGSWTTFSNNTNVNLDLDNLSAWNLQVKATDKFGNSTQSITVPKGKPIIFFDTNKLSVGVNCFPAKNESFEINGKTIFDMVYPIGTIYYSNNNTNPGTFFSNTTWTSVSSSSGEYKWRRTG